MKKDNNLFHVVYNDKEYWFTKQNYITKLANLQQVQIFRCMQEKEYADKYNIMIEIVDGSKILYEQINVI